MTSSRTPPVTPDPAYGAQPNFVVIYTDDQDASSFTNQTMPITHREIVRRGTQFTNYYDTTPLCCPARAGLLTGQYGHNNGVLANKPGYGDLSDNDNNLPVWLQRAGYRTAIVGKFLNGYESAVEDKDEVAPGWDLWSVEVGNGRGYYDFKLAVNGRQRKETLQGRVPHRRPQPACRRGRRGVVGRDAVLPLGHPERSTCGKHQRGQRRVRAGARRCRHRATSGVSLDAELPRLPGVLETDVSDKPAIVSGQPPISPKKREILRHRYQCRLETLPAVDRGIGEIVEALREAGELDETILDLQLRQRHIPGPASTPRR